MAEHPAGWYRDPKDPTLVKEWNGQAWTGQTKRIPIPPVEVLPPIVPAITGKEVPAPIPVPTRPTIASDDEPISYKNPYANKREQHILESKPFRFRESKQAIFICIITLFVGLLLAGIKNSSIGIVFLVAGFWFYWIRNEKKKALLIIDLEISQNDIADLRLDNKELENFNKALSKYDVLEAFTLENVIKKFKVEKTLDESIILELNQRIKAIRETLIEVEDIDILQGVGIYKFDSILGNTTAYKTKIKNIEEQIKEDNKQIDKAILTNVPLVHKGKVSDSQKILRDMAKLVLRAYNAEVEDALRTLKPYKVEASIDRLDKVKATIEKLGINLGVTIKPSYHNLRIKEIKLNGDYLAKLADEKEEEKAERERLKEEEQVQKEIAIAKEKLEKESNHYENLLKQAQESGNQEAMATATAKLEEVKDSIESVEARAANIRLGYVYVISNIGSFGEGVVKIGLTRRLEYQDRIKELSGASVPFEFDIHAIVFSNDAVALETKLHHEFDKQRVNKVNNRKEFFRTPASTVKDAIEKLTGETLLVYNEIPLASDWRMSMDKE